ncbi:MAG TPA: GDP-mannose 4,6-dehydratase [Candidatus Binatia bacterium]|nr:GDP-mannose 4,6-dehydratase [Candidatus Binatia bacterium]
MSAPPGRGARAARFEGRRCLVTGGMGFIGSNLALALADAGAEVRVVDAMIPTHGANLHNLEGAARPIDVVVADVGDCARIRSAVAEAEFVFNLAGQISHVDSMEDPIADFDWNARSHLAFLELLRAVGSRAVVVYTSTRQIYGRPLYVPVDESHPVQPVDVNGISQHAAEQFHLLYARVHGLRACSLRLTNVYGPRLRLRGSRQGVLAVFLQRALEGQTIPVYGDGEHIRDFLYVSDAVEALLAAALAPEAVGEAFNVSHSVAVTLREAAEAIVDAAGSGRVELVPWPRERAAIDIGDFLGDFAKARRILGWEPRVSFGDGLRATIAFYREHRHWYL